MACFLLFSSILLYSSCVQAGIWNDISSIINDLPFNVLAPPTVINETDIKLILYTRDNADVVLPLSGKELLALSPHKSLKYILHGWMESTNRMWMSNMRKKYIEKGDYQVIEVDWSKASQKLYPVAARNSRVVGRLLGMHLVYINRNVGIPLSNIHLVGHSMGGMVSGFAGKEVVRLTGGEKIARISGLDISGRKYVRPGATSDERLDKIDADFVDVTHTDPGQFGLAEPVGHVDFYVNNGTAFQPGCPSFNLQSLGDLVEASFDLVYCDHVRSHELFTESINSHGFIAQQCSSWEEYVSNQCLGPAVVYGEDTPSITRGIYYFKTNSKPPYALNVL